MGYSTKEYAFPLGRHVPERYGGKVLRIDSGATHPGYTKLIRDLDTTEHVQQRGSNIVDRQYYRILKVI